MVVNPLTLVLTVLGGLIVAGILGWIRKSRLCVLVPRMYSYSQITDRGQLVEITIFNRGFKTEESVEVTLNSTLKYEMLGTSNQDATLIKNKLVISRLAASDEIAVILVVENGVFKSDDIIQCLSKETKGVIASKLELVPMTASQRVGLIIWIVLIPALLYGSTYGIDYYYKNANTLTNSSATSESKMINVHGWKVNKIYSRDNILFKNLLDQSLVISTNLVSRKRDITNIRINFENKSKDIIEISSFELNTTNSESKIPSYDRRITGILLFPNKAEERFIKVIIPEKSNEVSEKTIFVEALILNRDGESLSLIKEFVVN